MNMKHSNRNHQYSKIILGIIVIAVVLSALFVDNIYIIWAILSIFGINALYLVIRHGWQWWNRGQGDIDIRERFIVFLVSLMFLFLVTGTMLFMQAFYDESLSIETPHLFLNAEYLLRSLACSFQLFTGNIDSNVVDGISDQPVLKGLISLQAFLSFCCTVAILLSLAYARVWAYYKLHRKTKIDSTQNHSF